VKPGPLLADARRRAGLTQAELAGRLGTVSPRWRSWSARTANPTVRTLERALRATGSRIEARPVPPVDESPIRAQLALPPVERIRQLERRAAEVRRLVVAGQRARGERA
jgi:transcriptional regulator with XRE-family HTH domain